MKNYLDYFLEQRMNSADGEEIKGALEAISIEEKKCLELFKIVLVDFNLTNLTSETLRYSLIRLFLSHVLIIEEVFFTLLVATCWVDGIEALVLPVQVQYLEHVFLVFFQLEFLDQGFCFLLEVLCSGLTDT